MDKCVDNVWITFRSKSYPHVIHRTYPQKMGTLLRFSEIELIFDGSSVTEVRVEVESYATVSRISTLSAQEIMQGAWKKEAACQGVRNGALMRSGRCVNAEKRGSCYRFDWELQVRIRTLF